MTSPIDHTPIFFFFSADENDIIEEALYYFKANVFFKSYEVKVSEINDVI